MGEVYRARDTRLGRDVAIKVLPAHLTDSPQALERFQRESKSASSLNHPNICTIYDVGFEPPFIAFELLEGETLHDRLARGPLPIAELVDTSLALTNALEAAHSRGIIHRDIKPSNLFLTPHGPKILDFGLAKTTVPASAPAVSYDVTRPAEAMITDPGSTVGTIAYMSPEQLRGRDLDARTDLFSLGLVLYEMATARPAFAGDTTAVISGAILHEPPVPPQELRPDLPGDLARIILKLLEKDRDDRYQTAADLRADLRRLKREIDSGSSRVMRAVDSSSSRAPSGSSGAVPPHRASTVAPAPASSDSQVAIALASRHWRPIAGAVVALVALFAGGLYLVRRERTPAAGAGTGTDATPSVLDLQISQLTRSGNAEYPAISPDGKYVAYVEADPVPDTLWIRQTTSDSNVRIVAPLMEKQNGGEVPARIFGATVTPDGGFVDFTRLDVGAPGALWRVPFLGGTPRKLIEDVSGSPVGWSPDGRHLAFVRVVSGQSYSVVVADADGTHERVLATRSRPAFYFNLSTGPVGIAPAWSPDGTTIAVPGAALKDGVVESQFVFVRVSDGSERVAPGWGPSGNPALGLVWLDSASLAFAVRDEPGAPAQLWRVSYPDGRRSRLTNDLNDYTGISLTADRSALVTARTEQRVAIWVGDANGGSGDDLGAPAPFAGRLERFSVKWSGDRLLYDTTASGRPALAATLPGSGRIEEIVPRGSRASATSDGKTIVYEQNGLWKADAEGRRPVQLVPGSAFEPIVLPDDRRVLFRSSRGGDVLSPWIVSLDGGEPTEVVHLAVSTHINLSRDGRSILFTTPGQQNRSFVMVCDLPACSNQRRAPVNGEWTPDGRDLAYATGGNIWLQSFDGRPPRQLTHFNDDARFIVSFDWSRDGKRLAIARATTTSDIVLFKGLKRPS